MKPTTTLKGLPVDEVSFVKILKRNLLYADNTKYVHELLQYPGNQFFLSRPRRFGKTLLLDVIDSIFRRDRSDFKDYWIGGPESDY